jgi:hypothetical protein
VELHHQAALMQFDKNGEVIFEQILSSYWLFSRSETPVKGSDVLRSKARCLRSP